jgi:hypothetical protein
MGELVYALCAITSFTCAALLTRSWLRTRSELLFWSSVCFVGFTVNNVLLFVDEVLYPDSLDLTVPRAASAFVAVLALVIGLVWSSKS